MPVSLFDTNLESKVTLESEATSISEDLPFRILLMGDWSGNSGFSKKSLSERRPIEIDRDEFDGVLRRISPELELNFQGDEENSLKLIFESLDDFHPDNIFKQLPLFADLKEIRQKLKKAETFEAAAREVRSWYSESKEESEVPAELEIQSKPESLEQGNLLDQILDNSQGNPVVRQVSPKSELSELIGKIVAPHIVRTDLKEQSKLLAIVDEVISDLMRKILHHRDFQQLEAAWRGLYFLVRRIETDSNLKIALIHITKDELSDNLSSVGSLSESQPYKWLIEDISQVSGKEPWAVICGNYDFSLTVEDTATLLRMAKLAEASVCPLISYIKPSIFGINSFAEISDRDTWKISENSSEYKLWTTLRSVSESSYLGLAIPRFIGRFPYGTDTEPAEMFAFEEVTDKFNHDDYLWLNPCFACGVALAQEYRRNGWEINQDSAFEIENLPLHMYQFDGSTKTTPCAEIEMTEAGYNIILQQGLMALISFRDADKIRLSALRSISATSPLLKGKWLK